MDEVERIGVKLAAETGEFFKDINHAVDKGTRIIGDGFDTAGKKGGFLSSAIGGITKGLGAIGLASMGINAVAGAIGAVTSGMLAGNIQFEQYETSFSVLLGSTEAAKQRLDELSKFAARTPFELPDVVQASKLLQTFGGDAIATGPVLEMVGDMASAAGVGFSEVATWVGRAYTNIQGGRPFGEAAQRLQELGLLGGTARTRLEDLSKSGASGEEVWAEFTKTMGGFNGMMVKQSQTFGGLTSTLIDNFNLLKRKAFAGLFEALKGPLNDVIALLGSPEIIATAEKMGTLIGKGAEMGIEGIHKLIDAVQVVASAFRDPDITSSGFVGALETIGVALHRVVLGVDVFVSAFRDPDITSSGWVGKLEAIAGDLRMIFNLLVKVAPIVGRRLWKDFVAVWRALGTVLRPVVRFFRSLAGPMDDAAVSSERLATFITLALEAWLAFLAVKQVVTLTQNIVHTGKELIKVVQNVAGTVKQTIEIVGKLIDKVQDIASKVVQTISRAGERLVEAGRLVREVVQNIFKPIGEKLIQAGTVVRNVTQKVTVKTDEKVDLKSLGKRLGLKILEGMAAALVPSAIGLLIAATPLTAGAVLIAAGIAIAAALVAGVAFYIGYNWWNEIRDAIVIGFNTFLQGIGALGAIIVFALFGDLRRNVLDWFDKNVEQPARRFLADLPGVIREGFEDAFKELPDIKQRVLDWFDENVARPFHRFIDDLPGVVADFFTRTLPEEISRGLPNVRQAIASIAQAIIDLPSTLTDIKNQFDDWLHRNVTQPFRDFVGKAFQLGVDIIAGLIGGIAEKLSGILQPVIDEIEKGYHAMLRFLGVESPSTLFHQVGVDIVQGLINGLISLLPNLFGFFIGLPIQMLTSLGDQENLLWSAGSAILGGLLRGAQSAAIGLATFFVNLPSTIIGSFNILDPVTMFYNKGRDIVDGLWRGIQSLKGWLEGKVRDLAGGIFDTFKDGLGKLDPRSPSEYGVDVGEGFGLGLLKGLRGILPSIAHGLDQFTAGIPGPAQLTPAFQGQLVVSNAQLPTLATVGGGTDSSRRMTNYGKVIQIFGPGRKSRDVLMDIDRMVR